MNNNDVFKKILTGELEAKPVGIFSGVRVISVKIGNQEIEYNSIDYPEVVDIYVVLDKKRKKQLLEKRRRKVAAERSRFKASVIHPTKHYSVKLYDVEDKLIYKSHFAKGFDIYIDIDSIIDELKAAYNTKHVYYRYDDIIMPLLGIEPNTLAALGEDGDPKYNQYIDELNKQIKQRVIRITVFPNRDVRQQAVNTIKNAGTIYRRPFAKTFYAIVDA